jgi:hypothetical protein
MRAPALIALASALATVLATALFGCSVEGLSPVGPDASAPPADAGHDASPLPPPHLPIDAGMVRRTVSTENPLGSPGNNLFVDGDFELSSVPYAGGQYGVLGFEETGGYRAITAETGGICRTGLHCAGMDPKKILYFRGVASANGKGQLISVWIKPPPAASCKGLLAVMVGCDNLASEATLKTKGVPDAAGWCEYSAHMPPEGSSQCLYLENKIVSTQATLVDSAVMRPDDGTVSPEAAEFFVPPADLTDKLAKIRETMQRSMPLGR